jgi:hypothetical protein
MTNNQRRLGMGMILGAAGLLIFAYLLYGYIGWFSWVLVAIAAFNFVRGLLWFLNRGS